MNLVMGGIYPIRIRINEILPIVSATYKNEQKESTIPKFVDSPNINVSDSDKWTTSKDVSISYPTGDYINEYSYDAENWTTYNSKITLNGATTIYARSRKGDEVVSSSSYKITKIDPVKATISLDDLETQIDVGSDYKLPSTYDISKNVSGGNVLCTANGNEVSSTKDLAIGKYLIKCRVTTGASLITEVEKNIEIINVVKDNNVTVDESKKSVEEKTTTDDSNKNSIPTENQSTEAVTKEEIVSEGSEEDE